MPRRFEANFIQQVKSKVSRKIKESPLSMDYSFPGKFRVKASGKDKFSFVSNGKMSWYYRPPFLEGEKGEVTIKSVSHLKFLRLFDALYKGAKKDGYFKMIKKTGSLHFLFSEKIRKEIGTESVTFYGVKSAPLETILKTKKIEVVKTNKKRVNFIVRDIQLKKSFATDHFTFKIPKNTKVIKD